jgi:CheY-like chemotaxis protein
LKPGHYAGLSFTDNGQGMDAETVSRIFEPFFTTKGAENRSGLGLSTVYGIVHQCGGDISVRSMPGIGSSFTLYLPRIMEDVAVSESEPDTSLLQGSGNVLLVEDEASLRKVVAGYLRERGYVVYEAGDAQEALKISRHARVDLLLTDIVMPGTSGPELAGSLAGNEAMGVIFMSGYAEHAALQQAILQPNALFIQKPFRLRTLLTRIHEALHEGDAAVPEQN